MLPQMMPLPWVMVFLMIFFSFMAFQLYLYLFFFNGEVYLKTSILSPCILPW